MVVRGAHFRICSDGTLRGPDNTVAAQFLERSWHLGQRCHASFECAGPVYLRITDCHGRRECTGPYPSIRAAHGAIFAEEHCLGIHTANAHFASDTGNVWQEVSFVTSR